MKTKGAFTTSLQSVFLVVASFLGGYNFTLLFHEPTSLLGGMWATISGIIVIETTASNTLKSAKNRIIGTLIGAVVSGLYLFFFAFSVLGLGVCIAAGVLICYILGIQQYFKLTVVTITVILVVSAIEKELHPFVNAGLRFAESAIGTSLAIAVALVAYQIKKLKSSTD